MNANGNVDNVEVEMRMIGNEGELFGVVVRAEDADSPSFRIVRLLTLTSRYTARPSRQPYLSTPHPLPVNMFLQRSAFAVARRAVIRPAAARTFASSVIRRKLLAKSHYQKAREADKHSRQARPLPPRPTLSPASRTRGSRSLRVSSTPSAAIG